MKTFMVTMPIAGFVSLEVSAENKEAAIDAFYEKAGDCSGIHEFEDYQWDFYDPICSGNVLYVQYNESEVELIDDDQHE